MSYYYKTEEVKRAIGNNWLAVLAHFGPELEDALRRPGRHVHCPVHGGKHGDAFRLFRKDAHTTGGGICNTCGPRNDGFELLMWLRNWSFNDCVQAIGDYIGAPRYEKRTSAPSGEFVPRGRRQPSDAGSSAGHSGERQFRGKGIVVGYGRAPYKFEKSTGTSFYITLANKEGKERQVWGVDLERARTENGVGKGDLISLYYLGRTAVTVVEPVIDGDGVVVEEKTITTYRNEWEIAIEKKAETPTFEAVEHMQVANGAPEVIEYSESDAQAPAKRIDTREPQKVVPISNVPAWIAEATERMEKHAASRAKAGKRAASKINALWDDCVPLSSSAASPARLYFEKRGFLAAFQTVAAGDELRFHPDLEYYKEGEDGKYVLVGKYPAIVAAIRNIDGEILTLHRTYLSKHGDKAKVESAKKMMPPPDGVDINGGAIQIGDPIDGVLGVAEGLETALSAYRATGISTWSTVNAQMMKTVEVPAGTRTIIVWADLDKTRTGEKAAAALKERMKAEDVAVVVVTPQCSIPKRAGGVDWNDVLLGKGILGFPNPIRLRKYLGIQTQSEGSPLRQAFA